MSLKKSTSTSLVNNGNTPKLLTRLADRTQDYKKAGREKMAVFKIVVCHAGMIVEASRRG